MSIKIKWCGFIHHEKEKQPNRGFFLLEHLQGFMVGMLMRPDKQRYRNGKIWDACSLRKRLKSLNCWEYLSLTALLLDVYSYHLQWCVFDSHWLWIAVHSVCNSLPPLFLSISLFLSFYCISSAMGKQHSCCCDATHGQCALTDSN